MLSQAQRQLAIVFKIKATRVAFSSALVCSLTVANAQTLIDLSTQSKNVDFTRAPITAPLKTALVLSTTCSTGHMVLLLTAPAGANLYACVNTNVWALQGNNVGTEIGGTLPVAKGGTGATTLTGVLIGNGTAPTTGTSAVPMCSKYTVPYTSVQAAAISSDVTLFTLPARGKITAITIKHSTAFAGTAITALTVSVGTSGNATAYASAYNILQAVSNTAMQDDGGHYSADFASHAVTASFNSTGANLSALTAGSLDIWACIVTLP